MHPISKKWLQPTVENAGIYCGKLATIEQTSQTVSDLGMGCVVLGGIVVAAGVALLFMFCPIGLLVGTTLCVLGGLFMFPGILLSAPTLFKACRCRRKSMLDPKKAQNNLSTAKDTVLQNRRRSI